MIKFQLGKLVLQNTNSGHWKLEERRDYGGCFINLVPSFSQSF